MKHVIEYPREFDIKSLEDEIANTLEIQALNISEILEIKLKERIVNHMLPKVLEEERKKIFKEIEANSNPRDSITEKFCLRLD